MECTKVISEVIFDPTIIREGMKITAIRYTDETRQYFKAFNGTITKVDGSFIEFNYPPEKDQWIISIGLIYLQEIISGMVVIGNLTS